jgi:hypothetical protein
MARDFYFCESAHALNQGAFDIVATRDQPNVIETARRADVLDVRADRHSAN